MPEALDTDEPQGSPPTSSSEEKFEGGGAGLNLDRLRVATDKLIDAVCVGEPWQVSGAQAAWDRTIAEIRERVRTLEAVAEAARAVVKVAGSYREDGIPVSPTARALHEALAAAGGPDGQ